MIQILSDRENRHILQMLQGRDKERERPLMLQDKLQREKEKHVTNVKR